jgi:hypothetical protein
MLFTRQNASLRFIPLMDALASTDRTLCCERERIRYSRQPSLGRITAPKNTHGDTELRRFLQFHKRWQAAVVAFATAIVLTGVLGIRTSNAQHLENGDWIETWTASPQPIWTADFFAPLNIPRSLRYQTVSQIATIPLGGTRVRIVLSNEYGSDPLVIGAAHVAVAGQGGAIVAGSDRAR